MPLLHKTNEKGKYEAKAGEEQQNVSGEAERGQPRVQVRLHESSRNRNVGGKVWKVLSTLSVVWG